MREGELAQPEEAQQQTPPPGGPPQGHPPWATMPLTGWAQGPGFLDSGENRGHCFSNAVTHFQKPMPLTLSGT